MPRFGTVCWPRLGATSWSGGNGCGVSAGEHGLAPGGDGVEGEGLPHLLLGEHLDQDLAPAHRYIVGDLGAAFRF